MTWVYRIAAGLALLATAFAGGWFARPPVVKTETKVQTQVVEKEVVRTVVRTIRAPDGTTTTETETTANTNTTTTSNNTNQTKGPTANVAAGTVARRNWSVGVQWQPDWKDRTWVPAAAEVGYRVTADLWLTGAYNWKENAALVGVRWEF
jgi:hypothetical protein